MVRIGDGVMRERLSERRAEAMARLGYWACAVISLGNDLRGREQNDSAVLPFDHRQAEPLMP